MNAKSALQIMYDPTSEKVELIFTNASDNNTTTLLLNAGEAFAVSSMLFNAAATAMQYKQIPGTDRYH